MKNIKTTSLAPLIFIASLTSACNQEQPKVQSGKVVPTIVKVCYVAVDESDTVLLTITDQRKSIEGNLTFNYTNGVTHKGTLKGLMHGDTLLADYNFTTGDGKWRRNPVALLKRNGRLILGVGIMETTWGRNYFAKSQPIDYDKGRFIFKEVNCELK